MLKKLWAKNTPAAREQVRSLRRLESFPGNPRACPDAEHNHEIHTVWDHSKRGTTFPLRSGHDPVYGIMRRRAARRSPSAGCTNLFDTPFSGRPARYPNSGKYCRSTKTFIYDGSIIKTLTFLTSLPDHKIVEVYVQLSDLLE